VHVLVDFVGHVPALHDAARVCTPSAQPSARHWVIGYVQLVLPAAHAPAQVLPLPEHCGRVPCGWLDVTCVHFPSEPTTLHALHCSPHALSQHSLSTQKLDWHCAIDVHALPLTTLPHDPPTHGCPTQSPSTAQVVAHAAPWHLNGAHVTVRAAAHVPSPSHLAASLSSFLAVSHEPAAHTVPLA
jgi:hypothetical protein